MGEKNKKENKMESTKDSYKKNFNYIEIPDLTKTYNPEDSLSFINPLNDVPESRLLNFTFKKSKTLLLFSDDNNIKSVTPPDIITVNKITILRNKNTLKIMENYINECYTENLTDSEKNYTSCNMNRDQKLLAIQITECDNTCILSMAFDDQEVWYNYYNKNEFMTKFINTNFFDYNEVTKGCLDAIFKFNLQ